MDNITNNSKPFQCADLKNKRADNWVVIPSDLAECPKITNLECSVVCVRHDFANDESVSIYSFSLTCT